MASAGAYVAVAVGCSAFGFAAGVGGDLLRQRLLLKGKAPARQHEVPDVEGNLQASFLERPGGEAARRSGAAAPEPAPKAGLVDSIASTTESASHVIADALPYPTARDGAFLGIADALPYGAGEGEPLSTAIADALPYVVEVDLSRCLPGCVDPARGVHHAKCPNHASSLVARQAAPKVEAAEAPAELSAAAEQIKQTGVVPYCESFARRAVPYGPPTLSLTNAEEKEADNA